MPKVFLKLLVINLALLLVYLCLSFLEWIRLLSLPLIALVNWTPLRTQIWFGGTVPVTVDGLVWIDHWSFTIILFMTVVNLIAVWQIEHKKSLVKT